MTALSAIKFEPEWEGPEEGELENTSVDKRFQDRVERYHVGLKNISLKAEWRDQNGALLNNLVQTFRFKNGGKNKIPTISPELLAQLICLRGQKHAEQVNQIVSYRVTFYGDNDELDGPFQHQGSFRIDGRREDDDTTRRRSRREEEESVEENEEDVDGVRHGRNVRLLPTTVVHERDTSVPSEAATMLNLATQAVAGILAEGRAALQQLRMEFSASATAQREDYRAFTVMVTNFIDALRDELKGSRSEVSKANDRLIKLAEQYSTQSTGQQEAMRQSWAAFQTGMQMMFQSNSNNMNWERQIMFMQFDELAKKKVDTAEKTSWLKDLAPYAFAAFGQILSAKGAPQGQILQDLAAEALKGKGEEEEDDEEESVKNEKPRTPRTVMGVPNGADLQKHYQENPIASLLQLLNTKFTKEQKDKLQKIVDPSTWNNLQAALSSTTDTLAKTYLLQFVMSVNQAGLTDQLLAEMTDEQKELFDDLNKLVLGNIPGLGGSPKAPTITTTGIEKTLVNVPTPSVPKKKKELGPNATIGEVRAYAKTTHGLTFSVRAKKEEILDAIAKAEA